MLPRTLQASWVLLVLLLPSHCHSSYKEVTAVTVLRTCKVIDVTLCPRNCTGTGTAYVNPVRVLMEAGMDPESWLLFKANDLRSQEQQPE